MYLGGGGLVDEGVRELYGQVVVFIWNIEFIGACTNTHN